MEERRKFERLPKEREKAVISFSGSREEAEVLDISTGGMKVFFSRPVEVGSVISGEFRVTPDIGPFYVKGRINRVVQKDDRWEVAVEFEKVSTYPIV